MEKKYCKLNDGIKVYIVESSFEDKVKLRSGNTIVITDIQNIHYIDNIQKGKEKNNEKNYSITVSDLPVSNEIMLRHKHKEDAIAELDKYIDQAIVGGIPRVRIIHGKHGGVLRAVVHEYLAQSPFVKEFHIADYTEGGLGVTIAILGKKRT